MLQAIELGCESIPAGVLQIYVYLTIKEQAGDFALLSIAASVLTTGFTSALIAFDLDVDVKKRMNQPKFYGYVPDDYQKRARCFVLMTIISTLHNISRSIGCALLVNIGGKRLFTYFVCGELLLLIVFKIAMRDFMAWFPVDGALGALLSLCYRITVKIIVDFSGCIHLRHP